MLNVKSLVSVCGLTAFMLGVVPVSGLLGASGSAGVAYAACPCSIWPDPVVPGFVYDDPTPIEMGLRFRSDSPGYVTGVRFFKAVGATGTHIGRLWTTGGVKLAEVTFTGETADGWQSASFPVAVAIQANTTYIISYYVGDGNKRFSDTYDFFVSAGVDNPPLHALQDGVDGPNGIFSDDGGWFNKTFRSSNYWVDLIFDDTPPPPDVTPPTVGSVIPVNGATGVLVSSNVTAAFNEPMDALTIDVNTVELRDPSTNLVTASVSYVPGSYSAVLDPTADLAYNTTYTALIKSGASGVKDVAQNALATDYTWTFTTEAPDLTPPTVSSVMPIDGVTRLRPETRVTARFSEDLNPGTIDASTFELRDPSNNLVPAVVTYDAGTMSATLTPDADLTRNATYTARVLGGPGGVKDALGNAMVSDYSWSFSVVAQRPPVDQAPGGPILIIASSTNLYTRYLTEILRTEGLNEFDIADLSQVTAGMLAAHDVVVLGDMALGTGEVSLLTDWVNDGGNLIAMRPDKQLAGLLGLTDAASTLSDAYLLIDTAQNPGTGIVGQTLQFHGDADAYTPNGATVLGTLYSDLTTPTPYPAVTMRSVGSNGGVACAFTFDLARSIVYTHQGNPAWQINHVNPLQTYGTALDLFYPDWVDFNRITIPQADEQQRFLANLILFTNEDKKPLPRFWYLPKGKKAAIILTGDDHWGISSPSGQTRTFFDRHKQLSPPGCSVDDWECVRSSSYGFDGCLLTDQEMAAYTAEGFEFGLHADAGLASGQGWCGAWDSNMPEQYAGQLEPLMLKYASIPVQGSERSHCYSWFGYTGAAGWQGYAGTPEVEVNLDIHMDTNISYNPAGWATINPAYQMGSAMMMRFAQVDNSGVMTQFLDIYNAGTQMNDDNGQGAAVMRTIVDSFLDNALGPQGFYGGFTVNMHSDNWYGWSYDGSDQIVASAQARGIPVVSGRQMVEWLDGRNSSSFGSIAWDGTTLDFTVAVGAGARNLMGMIPSMEALVPLNTLTRDGSPVAFTIETIKGRSYAFFPAEAGTYAAVYTPDTEPPVITGVTAQSSSGQTASIDWTTNEPATSRVDHGTSPGALAPGATDATLVTQHTVQLSGLVPNTTYYYRVVSEDGSGNSATSPATAGAPATFTTPAASFFDYTVTDFGEGSPDASLYISQMSDGEVILNPTVGTEFSGTGLPAGWSLIVGPGTPAVGSGVIMLNGCTVGPAGGYAPGHSVEATATFTAGRFQHVGFGVDYTANAGDAWAMVSTGANGTELLARCWTGAGAFDTQSTPIPGSYFGTPHRYRVDWNTNSIDYYVDDVLVATHNVTITAPMRPLVADGDADGATLTVDWLHMSPYANPGVFTSRIFDGGVSSVWGAMTWTSDVPVGTTLSMSARTGDVPVPDGTWTPLTPILTSGDAIGGTSRYVQYQATLSTADPAFTPELQDVQIQYAPMQQSTIAAVVPAGTCISSAHPCVDVPVTFTRIDATPVRGFSARVRLSPELVACGAQFVQGTYLSAVNAETFFQVIDNQDGTYDVDEAILGVPCGATGDGTLFTIQVGSASAAGTGTITIENVLVRDCNNQPVPGNPGAVANVPIDNTGPAATTQLSAQRLTSGNDGDGTTKTTITYTATVEPGGRIEVWRKEFGNYPRYDDGVTPGAIPAMPASYPPPGWTLTPVTASGETDDPPARDFWYYLAYSIDACDNATASSMTVGTLNYLLGDVTNGLVECTGDNTVATADVSLLGSHYGETLTGVESWICLDVGPTLGGSVNGLPLTDGVLQFEDLVMFALNFGVPTLPATPARATRAVAEVDRLTLDAPAKVSTGETFDVTLRMTGAGGVQALSAALGWNAAVAEPVAVKAGALLESQGGVLFSPGPGRMDAALLGARAQGLAGEGVLAVWTFRARTAGDPGIAIRSVEARDATNRSVTLGKEHVLPSIPTTTAFERVTPNPFKSRAALSFSLAVESPIKFAIYSIDGRRIRTLANGLYAAGVHEVSWNGIDGQGNLVRPGLYFARLETNRGAFTRSLVHVR